jgi:hypothetical protein
MIDYRNTLHPSPNKAVTGAPATLRGWKLNDMLHA